MLQVDQRSRRCAASLGFDREHRSRYDVLLPLAVLAATIGIAIVPARAYARVVVAQGEGYELQMGFRLDPRLEITSIPNMTGGHDVQRDLMIRRMRLKGSGRVLGCSFEAQIRIDNVDQIGKVPAAQVDHTYVECDILEQALQIRVGNIFVPFSRETLTGDETQILVDRGLVHDDLDSLGLADLALGVVLKGSQLDGLIGYTFGAYDNGKLPGENQGVPMLGARFDLNLLDTKNVMRDTAFGEAQYLSFGVNAVIQPDIHAPGSDIKGSRNAIGVDAMADMPAGPGRIFVRGEVDRRFVRDSMTGLDQDAILWTGAAGYLIAETVQPAIRIAARKISDQDALTLLGFGFNFYLKEHALKIQTDFHTKLSGPANTDVSQFRLQLQLEI